MKIKWNSLGIRVGFTISLALLIILGANAIYEAYDSYRTAFSNGQQVRQEQAKTLSEQLEHQFSTAYQAGIGLRATIQNTLEYIPEQNRNRALLMHNLETVVKDIPAIHGIGIYFEPNAFDGKDASFISKDATTGRFAQYVTRTELEIDGNKDYDWYTQAKEQKKSFLPIHIMIKISTWSPMPSPFSSKENSLESYWSIFPSTISKEISQQHPMAQMTSRDF